MSSLVTLYL